jgi:hypothetical protein
LPPPGPLCGPYGTQLIVIGYPKHRAFALRIAHLIRAGARLVCAVAPVRGVIEERLPRHFPAPAPSGPPLTLGVTAWPDNSRKTEFGRGLKGRNQSHVVVVDTATGSAPRERMRVTR